MGDVAVQSTVGAAAPRTQMRARSDSAWPIGRPRFDWSVQTPRSRLCSVRCLSSCASTWLSVLGLAGPSVVTAGVVRWLVLQSAILQGPDDLQVVVLTQPAAADDWQWLRWLPHAASDEGRRVLLGCDDDSCTDRISELLRRTPTDAERRVLLVVDQAHQLRELPGLGELLRRAGDLGVRVVCVAQEERQLPQDCAAVAGFDRGSVTRLTAARPRGTLHRGRPRRPGRSGLGRRRGPRARAVRRACGGW